MAWLSVGPDGEAAAVVIEGEEGLELEGEVDKGEGDEEEVSVPGMTVGVLVRKRGNDGEGGAELLPVTLELLEVISGRGDDWTITEGLRGVAGAE